MARELAIPCFLAGAAVAIAPLVTGGVAAESRVVAAKTGTIPEAIGGQSATDSGVLEKIILAAHERALYLRHTWLAITAFSQQDTVIDSVRSLDSLSEQTPRMSFQHWPYDTFGRVK